jgi:vancomycin permeability regulator SanA
MYRARNVYGVNSALIVTQRFHVARSIYIARNVGIDAYGIPTDSTYSDFKNSFREFFAAIKAFYEVNRQVVPEYATLKA